MRRRYLSEELGIYKGEIMVSKQDLEELSRLATNTYDNDKRFLYRVINGINAMDKEITQLKAENEKLKEKKSK